MGAPTSEVGYTSPQPGGGTTKAIWSCGGIGGGGLRPTKS
jgi:hypothetical protein